MILALALTGCRTPDPPSPPVQAVVPSAPATVVPTPPLVLQDEITAAGMMVHLEVLQEIADDNAGTRVFSTSGYLDSIAYLEEELEAVGLSPTRETYTLSSWDVLAASLGDADGAFPEWDVLTYSASGSTTAVLTPVDLQLPPGPTENSSTSGCEDTDFDTFPVGTIALIQRGSCPFSTKVENAEAAGATAVLVFNEGQIDRTDVIQGTLDPQGLSTIPALGLSFGLGEALAAAPDTEVTVLVDAERTDIDDHNLLVEIAGSDPNAGVIMIGAHLDSVQAGPGINDNGSGSAFLLETALRAVAAGWEPVHTVRFAWWGAEEQGLVGSSRWVYDDVTGLPDTARLDALDAYLNFDMMASSNGARFLYDGDNSDIEDGGGSEGSGAIEAVFREFYDAEGLATEPEGMFVPTDSWWFVLEGVPTGGLFSGALGVKSEDLAGFQGGTAGLAYDVCYHQSCDRLDQIDPVLYEELGRGGAYVLQQLAESPGSPSGGSSDAAFTERARPFGCHGEARWDR